MKKRDFLYIVMALLMLTGCGDDMAEVNMLIQGIERSYSVQTGEVLYLNPTIVGLTGDVSYDWTVDSESVGSKPEFAMSFSEPGVKYCAMSVASGGSFVSKPFMVRVYSAPGECDNKIVAHRGGAKECDETIPDNSIAALRYAMELGCYASECDIYVTKDKNVVVAHADGKGKVNGFYPWEATLAEIREAGTLSNGEQVPTLEDYLDYAMKGGGCTRIWLDIKNITKPSTLPEPAIDACRQACRIIREKKREKWVEFICTGNKDVMTVCDEICRQNGIPIGWMGNAPVKDYLSKGYTWANLSLAYMDDEWHTGTHTVDEFVSKGVAMSVYNVDEEPAMHFYLSQYDKMKAICTNYPAKLIRLARSMQIEDK